jgi:hypothetical protein
MRLIVLVPHICSIYPPAIRAKKLRQLQESIGEHDNVGFDIYVFEYVEYASIYLGTRRYINANEGEVQC